MEKNAASAEPVEAIGRWVAARARELGPAVVGLGRGWGLGSGVVSAPGRVLTSAHNVRGGETTVTFRGGRQAAAELLGSDPDRDVALLEVDTGDARPVAWEPDDRRLPIGAPVVALADPGGRGLRATPGFVSASGRRFRGLRGRRVDVGIEHTAALPRGSSGGPLVDVEGRLLGLNTLRLEGGLVLAVAADRSLRESIRRITSGHAAVPARLGVALAPAGVARRMRRAVGLPERDGLLVRAVEEGSAAARSGLAPGDLIVSVDEAPVDDPEPLHVALEEVAGGGTLTLRVVRGAGELELTVAFDRGAGESGP